MKAILKQMRTDEQKARRRKFGDKGAKFGGAYTLSLRCSNTLTSVLKDNLVIEIKDISNEEDAISDP